MKNTLEDIEKSYWDDPAVNASYSVETCHLLRKKNIDDFTVEDYRILIGQNISLEILVPVAMEILQQNIFVEGDFYEGDLLKSVLASNKNYWTKHQEAKREIIQLFGNNIQALEELDTTADIRRGLKNAFLQFKEA